MDGGGSLDMVVSLLHRMNDCQYMYMYIVLLIYVYIYIYIYIYIYRMNVYEEILDISMLNVYCRLYSVWWEAQMHLTEE